MSGGIVIVDKPVGPTSFDVVAQLRRVFHTREIGHCGTLDPLASGVLVVAVGSYTRLVRVLTADDKRYTAVVRFGSSTTTDDGEGEVLATGDAGPLTEAAVRAVLPRFVGALSQVPPAFSAIHVDGERAYKRARAGDAPVMLPRDVVIHGIEVVRFGDAAAGAKDVELDVHCGKGTYIRALARDLGAALGVPAHLGALRRTASGAFVLADAVSLDRAGPADLRVGPAAVRGVPLVAVDEADARALGQGKRVPTAARFPGTGLAHASGSDALVALVHVEDGVLVVERGFAQR